MHVRGLLGGSFHFNELPLGAIRPVREDADRREADALVHADCAPVEAGDGERELSRDEARTAEVEPCLDEALPETLSRPFRMQPEPDLQCRAVGCLEMEEADQASVLVLDCEVTVATCRRVEQFGEIIRIGCPRSEEHTSELQSRRDLVCRLL